MKRTAKPEIAMLTLACAAGFAEAAFAREATISDVAIPSQFEYASESGTAPAFSGGWWKVYAEPQLDGLMAQLHVSNTTIAQASARLTAARAQARMGTASQMPQAGFTASASQASGPLINAAGGSGSLFTARATISWEADLLGRLSGERKAERLDAKAAEALLVDVRLLMEAETAHAYFEARYLGLASAEAARRSAMLDEAAAISVRRQAIGLIDQVAANRAAQRQDEARRTAVELEEARKAELRRLAFLLGDTLPPLIAVEGLTQAPGVPAGLPSTMLARRPDMAVAIARLEASDSRLQAARKGWLPNFSLTASGGAASPSLGQFLSASARDFGLSALLSLPIFDGGRRKAAIAARGAERDLAAAQYCESVLAALREVNDRLGALQLQQSSLELARDRLRSTETNRTIIAGRVANGTAGRAALIDADVLAIDMHLEELAVHHRHLAASIDLIEALGGGW